MIDLITVENVLNVVPIISLVVVFAYYSIQIRNQNKTRELQIFMQIMALTRTPEFMIQAAKIDNQEFNDFNDWRRKYGTHNPEEYAAFITVLTNYNAIGSLVKRGIIDLDFLIEQVPPYQFESTWMKIEGMIPDIREYLESHQFARAREFMSSYEYLVTEIKKLQEREKLRAGK